MTAAEHRGDVRQFQGGAEAFVWGLHNETGRPWYLEPERANLDRALVNASITCPVLSCRARLTTVSRSRSRGRDGLRHYAGGDHPGETLDHALACAAVEAWLRATHPQATITREAVSPDRSRRADVLATNAAEQSIAFEIQYSPLTVDDWRVRHDAYARQGIVDVWLWGHRGHNFHPAGFEQVELTAAQRAVVDAAGMPALFINPETRTVAIAYRLEAVLGEDGRPTAQRLPSLAVFERAHLELMELDTLRLTPQRGITSPRLRELRDSTEAVALHNNAIRERLAEIAAAQAVQAAEALSLRKVEATADQAQIRALLQTIGFGNRWGSSNAHDAIAVYLVGDKPSRIDSYLPQPEAEPRLVRWQCALYFELIAGHASTFTKWDALRAIRAAGVNMNQPKALLLVDGYCDRLTLAGYLTRTRSYNDWPAYKPTTMGAWW